MEDFRVSGERIEPDVAYRRIHRPEPDYARPLLQLSDEQRERILGLLGRIYGEEEARLCFDELFRLMRVYFAYKTEEMVKQDRDFVRSERFTREDVILITYGDLVVAPDEPPLKVMYRLLDAYTQNISTVHILPFFPYSSDRGFSVVDYEQVDPELGHWEDVEYLSTKFQLMFDGVINHVSAKSRWFQEYLNGNPAYDDFFIGFSSREAIGEEHLKLILRPRTSDLLNAYDTIHGKRHVWTTFSRDQIDLNYKNPRVLLRMFDMLLHYVRRGADLLRLDAVTYLWYELGTQSAHLDQTHAIIQLLRAVLDVVAPRVALVSETNVPHEDNISYFGDGSNEAQMVYNFALPPLVLFTFQAGDCTHLARWAATLDKVSDHATYFNFLDSHDGIGLLGARGILSEREIEGMIARVKEHGGVVSYRTDNEGRKSPYEMNITWWSAMNRPDAGESLDLQVDRHLASRSIALALRGVPGLYLLGLIGGENDLEAVSRTSEARCINRRVLDAAELEKMLGDPKGRGGRIARRMRHILNARVHCAALHPNGDQRVLPTGPAVFGLLRRDPAEKLTLLALTNVTSSPQEVMLRREELGGPWADTWNDLLSDRQLHASGDGLKVSLAPYEVVWAQHQANS
jgi:sucrose phosphorylase